MENTAHNASRGYEDVVHFNMQLAMDQLYRWKLDERKRTYAQAVKKVLESSGRVARMDVEFKSQVGEDLLLWDLFRTQASGCYIEVGAYDGVTYSPSYIFDAIGWHGLLVEASPRSYEACRRSRPNAQVVHAVATRPGAPTKESFNEVLGAYWSGMSYVARGASKAQQALMRHRRIRTKKVLVPTATLNDLVKRLPRRIDFAVIDVEGHENALLDGFDLRKWKPKVIIIEDITDDDECGCIARIEKCGYVLARRLPFNAVLIHERETHLLMTALESA